MRQRYKGEYKLEEIGNISDVMTKGPSKPKAFNETRRDVMWW